MKLLSKGNRLLDSYKRLDVSSWFNTIYSDAMYLTKRSETLCIGLEKSCVIEIHHNLYNDKKIIIKLITNYASPFRNNIMISRNYHLNPFRRNDEHIIQSTIFYKRLVIPLGHVGIKKFKGIWRM